MENGIYIAKLHRRDEFEIAELFNDTWSTFRSLSQKYSEQDVIHCQLSFADPEIDATFSVSFPNGKPSIVIEHDGSLAPKEDARTIDERQIAVYQETVARQRAERS